MQRSQKVDRNVNFVALWISGHFSFLAAFEMYFLSK